MFNYPVGVRYLYTCVSTEASAEVIGHGNDLNAAEDIEMLTWYSFIFIVIIFFNFPVFQCSMNDKSLITVYENQSQKNSTSLN